MNYLFGGYDMHEYDDAVLTCFLNNQSQLFPEDVANSMEEAEAFLEECMAVVVDSAEDVIAYFNNEVNTADTKSKGTSKNAFIKVVDFIFYDKDINGYYFKDLTASAKLKVIGLALKLDNIIDSHFPGYKDELSSSYNKAKDNLITLYLNLTSEFCKNNDSICESAKNDFSLLKESLNLSWDVIKNLAKSGTNKLKEWYEIFSGK